MDTLLQWLRGPFYLYELFFSLYIYTHTHHDIYDMWTAGWVLWKLCGSNLPCESVCENAIEIFTWLMECSAILLDFAFFFFDAQILFPVIKKSFFALNLMEKNLLYVHISNTQYNFLFYFILVWKNNICELKMHEFR